MWVVCVRERGKPLIKNKTGKNGTYLVKSHLERQVTLYNQPSHEVRCTGYHFQVQL